MAFKPNPDREVKDGKAVVSAKELADFKSQYGEDKSLRDLLNADKGLRRKGESPAPAKEAPAAKEAAPAEEVKTAKKADPVKEAAPAKSSAMPDTYRNLSGKVKVKEAVKPPSEYEPGVHNIKRNLLNAPSDIVSGLKTAGTATGKYLDKTFSMEGREQAKKEGKERYNMKKGGVVSASSRGDGIAQRGKTRGKMC
jgi:hypothetical protein